VSDDEYEMRQWLRARHGYVVQMNGHARLLADTRLGPGQAAAWVAMASDPTSREVIATYLTHELRFAEKGRPEHQAAGRILRSVFDAADDRAAVDAALRTGDRHPLTDRYLCEFLARARDAVGLALHAETGRLMWEYYPGMAGRSAYAEFRPAPKQLSGATT
jgi:hypothetical protein